MQRYAFQNRKEPLGSIFFDANSIILTQRACFRSKKTCSLRIKSTNHLFVFDLEVILAAEFRINMYKLSNKECDHTTHHDDHEEHPIT